MFDDDDSLIPAILSILGLVSTIVILITMCLRGFPSDFVSGDTFTENEKYFYSVDSTYHPINKYIQNNYVITSSIDENVSIDTSLLEGTVKSFYSDKGYRYDINSVNTFSIKIKNEEKYLFYEIVFSTQNEVVSSITWITDDRTNAIEEQLLIILKAYENEKHGFGHYTDKDHVTFAEDTVHSTVDRFSVYK